MPRKTPVRELQADEENPPASPLRRSSRLASPGPSKLLQRRNSAHEDSPAKLPKAKRLSLSMRRESDDSIPKAEEKLKENTLDTPKRSTRVTRSSSKSPSSLLGDTESKPSSTRTRSRTGSISKIEEEINSENEEDVNPKSSQTEKSKVKARRPSIKDKIVSLEVIEESPKTEARSKATLNKKESLVSIAEDGGDSKEARGISSQVEKVSTEVEKRKTAVEEKEETATKSPIQSANSEVTLQDVTINGTKESSSFDEKKTETDSCKISPVVILNSIEKQMNYSEEKISSKKVEISPIKDETKPASNKSPVVVLRSIEKIISKQNHEKYVELDKKTEVDVNINKDLTSMKEKLKEKKNENGIDQSLDQKVLPDELCKSDDNKSMNVISKSNVEENVQSINVEEDKIGNKEDIIITVKEKLKDNINEDQLSEQKVNESANDSVKLQKENQLEKQDEVKEAVTINDNQCSDILTVTKENTKESLSSLLINQKSIIEGSDGSFSISLPDVQNNTQEDITNQSNIVDSTENRSECLNNISNSSENSDKENSHKDKPQISGTEFNEANISENEAIDPKQKIVITKESVLASNLSQNVNQETEQSSFYEPMEIEYTDFNCTVNSSVMESKDEEDSSKCDKNKEESTLVSTSTINKQSELKVEDINVTDQDKLQEGGGIASKEINDTVTENVKEVLSKSKSNLAEDENQDVTRESEICDEPIEESIKKTTDSLKLEQSVSEPTKEIISTDAQKSFAFNLDDEQFLSDEEEINDGEKSSLDTLKLVGDMVRCVNSRDADKDVQLKNESHAENQEINTAKSPSPVFSVDEKQCLSDNDENEITDNKIEEQSIKKLDESPGINKEEKSNEENIETEKPRSPSPTFSVDDSQNDDEFNKNGNLQEDKTITKELDKIHCVSKNSETTNENVESGKEKTDFNSESPNVEDQIKKDSELKESKAKVNEQSNDLKVTCDQEEVVKPAKSADDKKLIDKGVESWKCKSKKLSKKRRKSNIEDNLTSTVRALIENVDDLDAKVDALIEKEKESSNLNQDESDDELSQNSFIDDMAEEGEEDTPSEGSNDILDEGESLDSVDTTSGSDGSYEQGSFINDDEDNSLLSGEEDFLEEKPNRKEQPKRIKARRIISDSESNEDQPQVKLSEDRESLELKIASCDSDDKMSTDPYLGLTPPSHVSVQESSSDIDIRSFNNENEIIINDDDNLKSLEAMKDVTDPNSKQVDILKASSIICLDSDEDAGLQQIPETPSKPSGTSKTEKLQNEEEATNVADLTLLTKSPKSRSSLNIQECIRLEDVEDGTLTNKICGIVDFFYSNIKQNNSASGTMSLNVSLDFADTCEKEEATAENSNIEDIKSQSLKKRLSESVESLPEKKTSKRIKLTLPPRISLSNEDATVKTPTPAKKIKRKKRDVSEFDVESVDILDTSPTVKSKTITQRKDLINISNTDDSPAIRAKHLAAKENLTGERKKNNVERKKSKKSVKDSHLVDTDKENEEVIPQKTSDGKRRKHKKAPEQIEDKETTEFVADDEIATVNETQTSEQDIPRKQDKKKKKKLKHLLKIEDKDSFAYDVDSFVNDIDSFVSDIFGSNENRDKISKKTKSKFVKSNQQEIRSEIASTSENIAFDEINYKKYEKKKPKLAKPDEIKIDEGTDIDLNRDIKQKKKKKKLKTVDNKEISPIVEDETQNVKQTKLKDEIKSATSELVELTSNERSKKSKRKRKHDVNDEDNLSSELNTMASSKVPTKSEDETHKKSKKRNGKENATKTEKPISYFPSHMLEKLDTKTSNEEVPKIKKINEKRLRKKKTGPTFSVSTSFDSNPWISTPLETTIVPSKQNTLLSDAGKSAKKRKLQEENETFASKDFKNKMLYDTSRVKRMSTKNLLKNKMKKELLNR